MTSDKWKPSISHFNNTNLLSIKINTGIFCLMAKSTRWTVRHCKEHLCILSLFYVWWFLKASCQVDKLSDEKLEENLVKNYVSIKLPVFCEFTKWFFAAKVQNTKMNDYTLFGQNTAVLHTICEVPFIWGHARQKNAWPSAMAKFIAVKHNLFVCCLLLNETRAHQNLWFTTSIFLCLDGK